MVKKIQLNLQLDFKNEIIDPIIKEKKLSLCSIVRALARKVSNESLSTYAIDSTLFPFSKNEKRSVFLNDTKNLANPITDEYNRIEERFISLGNYKGIKKAIHNIMRDEVYGFFMNYDDKNLSELIYKYGDQLIDRDSDNLIVSVKISSDIFNDRNFLKEIRKNYRLSDLIFELTEYITENQINIFKYIDGRIREEDVTYNKTVKELDDLDNKEYSTFILKNKKGGYITKRSNEMCFSKVSIFIAAALRYLEENPEIKVNFKKSKRTKHKTISIHFDRNLVDAKDVKNGDEVKEILFNSLFDKIDDFEEFKKYFLKERRKAIQVQNSLDYVYTSVYFKSRFFKEASDLKEMIDYSSSSWNTVLSVMKEYIENQKEGV